MSVRIDRSRGVVVVLAVLMLAASAMAGEQGLSLDRAVPSDVYLFVNQRHNPERAFLADHWGTVWQALGQCGISEDLNQLLAEKVGDEDMAEVERIKARVQELVDGVDWTALVGGETAFAQRMAEPLRSGGGITMGPPDMAWLFRGDSEGMGESFTGLVAILEGMAEEVNGAVGSEVLAVQRSKVEGADMASVNLLRAVPEAPAMPLSVARQDDLIVITLGDSMMGEVLALAAGKNRSTALGRQKRFKGAFKGLPTAEDSRVFFDVQALLGTVRGTVDVALAEAAKPTDEVLNSLLQGEAHELNQQAWQAYEKGEYGRGLELVERAYALAPTDSRVLYYLACFHALTGNESDALAFLERAVDGGFYSPGHIASDPDLASLRSSERYAGALSAAREGAARLKKAQDTVLNSTMSGEAHELSTKAWAVYEEGDYQAGLELVEQAHAIAPEDSRVLYYLACFHNLTGDADQALDFLDRAVDGGFLSPRHIATDPDLESLRDNERYRAALNRAIDGAAEHTPDSEQDSRRIADRLLGVPAIFDYVAATESTNGLDVHANSVVALVEGAEENPFYPVIARRSHAADFTRYLPQETESFVVSSGVDLDALHAFVTGSMREAGARGEAALARWEQLQEQIGFHLVEDVLAWIEGDLAVVTLAEGAGTAVLLKVTDERIARTKMAAAIDFLTTRLAEAAKDKPALAMLSVRRAPVLEDGLEGFESLFFSMSPKPLVWGVADSHLVLASSPKAVQLCLETAAGTHEGVAKNQRVMDELVDPRGSFTNVALEDRRKLGQELAQVVGLVSMAATMASAQIGDAEERQMVQRLVGMLTKLTPVVSKIDFFESVATATTFDGASWHTHKVTHYAAPHKAELEQSAP